MTELPPTPTIERAPPGTPGRAREAHGTGRGSPAAIRAWTSILLLIGIALLVAHALTKQPHTDEGDLASAATSLLDRGRVAFPMSYEYGQSVRDAYYLAPPFYPAALAVWFEPFGRSLTAYRLFHVAWVVLLTLSWMRMVRLGTTSRVALPIAAGLFALNYDLINLGVSRYDIVCAALNAAAMAAYATWRVDRFGRAIVVANSLLALSALTHPYALFGLIGCLAIALANRDWRRVRPRHLLAGLAPYVVGFGAWILMIGGHWDQLRAQVAMQAGTRGIDYGDPLRVFASDFIVRWWQLFAGWREGVPAILRAKTLFLVLWAVVPFFALRRGSAAELRPLRLGVLVYTLAALLLLPLTDNMHVQIYNMHVIAGLVALTAMAFVDVWERWPRMRPALGVVIAGICLFGLAGIGLRVKQRDLQREYEPVQAFLEREVGEGDVVIGPSELGFELGFERHVRDDPKLSSIGGGELPRFIVASRERDEPLPRTVPCDVNVRVHDTTTYVEMRVATPKDSYRILRRVAPGDTLATGASPWRIERNCDGRAAP